MKDLLFSVFIVFVLFKAWEHFSEPNHVLEKNQHGFTEVVMPNGARDGVVYILAPKNCPKEAGKRADALELALRSQGVAVVRSSSGSLNINEPTPEQMIKMDNALAIMNDTIPAVFVNGMGSSNPQASEVFAQWRGF